MPVRTRRAWCGIADSGAAVPGSGRLNFPSIDVLRGFAALSVLVYHVIEHFGWTGFPTTGPLLWFRMGWMGVDLFLVISGFVISLSAASLLQRLPFREVLAVFARRRFARIAPLYYATAVLYVVLVVPEFLVHPELYKHLLTHALFVHNLSPEYAGSIDGPNWSVGLEMQFYVLCGLAAPLLWRWRGWQVAVVAVAVSWAWRFGALQLIPFEGPTGPFHRFVATTQLPGTLDEFAVGILLAKLLRGPRGPALLEWGRRYPWVPVAAAAAAMWLLLEALWRGGAFWDSAVMVVFWRTGCAIAFGAVLFAACCLQAPWVHAVSKPLRDLGTISFGIYLWHLPVILSVKRLGWVPAGQALWIVLAATLVLSAGSWHLFEKAFLRRAHRQSAGHP